MLLDTDSLELLNKSFKDAHGKLSRKEAKALHGDLPPGGVWRTVRGHHIYILNNKVIAGAFMGKTKARKATKKHLQVYQEHIDKEAGKGAGKSEKTSSKKSKSTKTASSKSKTATKGTKSSSSSKRISSTKSGSTKKSSTTKSGRKTASKKEVKEKETATKATKETKSSATKTVKETKGATEKTKITKKGAGESGKSKSADNKGAGKSVSKRTKKTASEGGTKSKTAKGKVKDIRTEAQKNRELAYDVGEKIGGARKDEYEASFKANPNLETLKKLENESPALAQKLVTKKQLLPDFDFVKEYENGVDLQTAIMKKLIFDRIAPKPESDTPEARRAYVHGINKLYRHLAGIKTWENMRNAIRELSDLARKGDSARIAQAQRALSGGGNYTYVNTEYYQKLLDEGLKAKAEMDFNALGDKLNNFFTDIKSRESTLKTVEKNMKEGWDKYLNPESKGKGKKELGSENKKWERKAEDEHLRIGGREAKVNKPEDLVKQFGVRGVEFGHWVNDSVGKYHLKRCAEAFTDLADVLGIDDKDVSLNGRLAIAFGARGKGSALAHYESDRKVINLTKYGGAGSLAHEWGHALDNILYQYSHGGKESLNMASDSLDTMGNHDPKLKVLYENVVNAMKYPAPGDKGAVKKVEVDSEKNLMAYYYPNMRQAIMNNPNEKGIQEAIRIGQDKIDTYDRTISEYTRLLKQNPDPFMKEVYEKRIKTSKREKAKLMKDLPHLIAQDMHRATGKPFKGTLEIPTGRSEYYQRMLDTDGDGKNYWSNEAEMFARVFESYIQHKLEQEGRYNNYLVHGTKESHVKALGAPFPIGKERQHMFKAMENLLKYVTKEKALKKALIMEILALGKGDMTEQLQKSQGNLHHLIHHLIYERMKEEAEKRKKKKKKKHTSEESDFEERTINHFNDNLNKAIKGKRSAYNVDFLNHPLGYKLEQELIYIPINRLKTLYQTEKATNWDKVNENVERMKRGEHLEPVVIGYDYDLHDGHHRLEASKIMGYTHVPCIVMKGTNDIERQRAIEAYKELWKSFDTAKHPRDERGRFTKVYHITKDPNFRHDPNHNNSGQEWGRGLYTAPADDVEYWHRALQDKVTGERHPYVVPMDISEAKLIHAHDIPGDAERAEALIEHFGSGEKAIEALEKEEKENVTGETYGLRPHEIAEHRLYAKIKGYDGIIGYDPKEGRQVILFDDSKVKYEPAMHVDEFFKKKRWGEL